MCIYETSVADNVSELQLNIIKWRNDGLYDTSPTEKLEIKNKLNSNIK